MDCGECGGGLWGVWRWTAGNVVVDCSKCGVVPLPSHPMSSAVLCVCIGAARRSGCDREGSRSPNDKVDRPRK